MEGIVEHLMEVRDRIGCACARAGRDPSAVELVAVSKTFPAEAVIQAAEAGQRVFGESRLQEAEGKMDCLPASLSWHFIGRLQRNKVRRVLPRFDVIHAVDSLRLAQAIDVTAVELGLFPRIFLQVNVGGEETKGGFEEQELLSGMELLLSLPRLEIQGLMTIPPPEENPEQARRWFVMLREIRDRLESGFGVKLPGLSMGMSGDFEIAIEEGATHVRVGSQIFGKRAYRVDGELGAG